MSIKAGANNNFGSLKWFGCFVKDANVIDEAMAWSYDVKQLAVDSANNLNMPSSLPDIHVITNPYATSAALVSAVSGAFKYHTYYKDGSDLDPSAMTSGEVVEYGLYAEASSFASSVASTSYYHFPFVPSGDWLHYAKGKTNYGLAGSSTFERWGLDSGETTSKLVDSFSSVSGNPHMFATSAEAFPTSSLDGAYWIDNFPRFQASNSEDKYCKCCLAWSFKGRGSVSINNITYKNQKRQFWMRINISVRVKMHARTGCDDECETAKNHCDWPDTATGSSKSIPHAAGGVTITTPKDTKGRSYGIKLHSVGESQVDLKHLDCERPKKGDNVYIRAFSFLGTDTSATPATPYTDPAYNPCKSKNGDKDDTLGFSYEALIGTGAKSAGAMDAHGLKLACGMQEPEASWGNSKATDEQIMEAIGSTDTSRMFVEGACEAAIDALFAGVGPGNSVNRWKGMAAELALMDCSQQR